MDKSDFRSVISLIDHFNIPVSDLKRSMGFYVPVLSMFGLKVLHREVCAVGFGTDFWNIGIVQENEVVPVHFAIVAANAALVRDFHKSAIAAGGTDNGAPGYRLQYGKSYYSAYVFDPDGHNMEAVYRGEPDLSSSAKETVIG